MRRRDAMLLGGAAMLPEQRPDQEFHPPGTAVVPGTRSGIFRGRLVIIFGTGPNVGLFVYSPKPGAGNLIASIAAAGGTDPFGNVYQQGITSYLAGVANDFAQQFADGMRFNSPSSVSPGRIGAAGGGAVVWQSGTVGAGDLTAQATLRSKNASGAANGQLETTCGIVIDAGGLTADTEAISSGQAGGLILQVTNTTAGPAAPNVRIVSAAAGDRALGILVTGDTFNRLLLDGGGAGGGRIQAGSGALAPDTALFRAAANQWAQDYTAFNNAGAAEVWQTVGGTGAAFAGTWANAAAPGVPLQYRRNAAPYKSVQWVGRVTNTVAQVAGSAITAAVPAAYRPVNTHDITCFNLTTGAVVRVSIGSTGVLTCQSAIAANDLIGIPDTSLGLDA